MKPKHVDNYFKAFGYDESDEIMCEMPGCWAVSSDIHHIEPRSKFGSKRKDEQDNPSNLIALCRRHHEEAHGPKSRELKQLFKLIIEKHERSQTKGL
jgi:hypothetical protein